MISLLSENKNFKPRVQVLQNNQKKTTKWSGGGAHLSGKYANFHISVNLLPWYRKIYSQR